MFKRARWMSVGAAAGAAGTVWAQRTVRRQLDRTSPADIAASARGVARRSAKGVVRRVSNAIDEGRSAMRDRDSDLRGGSIDLRPPVPGHANGTGPYRPAHWGDRSSERR